MKPEAKKLLQEARLKATPARFAILDLFSDDCKPMNAEEIFKLVKAQKNKTDYVTVYRTLASLEKKGIIKKVDLRRDSVYYELNNEHHHHHIACLECGTVEDFKLCSIEKISKEVLASSSRFKNITGHSLELFGVCSSCQKV